MNPKLAPAHFNLANALLQQGKIEEAIQNYKKGIEVDPKNALAYFDLARTL